MIPIFPLEKSCVKILLIQNGLIIELRKEKPKKNHKKATRNSNVRVTIDIWKWIPNLIQTFILILLTQTT